MHLSKHTSGLAADRARNAKADGRQPLPEKAEPDDEWLSSLDPQQQALLVARQPVCLSRADLIEARYSNYSSE